ASQRGGQGDRRAGLLQWAVSVHEHAPVRATDLRRLRSGADVLGNRHHEDEVLVAAMRDDVHRGATLVVREGQGARHGPGRVRLVGLEGADVMTTDVYPGKDLGTLEVAITDEMVQHYIKGLAEPNPWYTATSPFGGPVAPVIVYQQADTE